MQVAKDDPEKGKKIGWYMNIHKSTALLVLAALIPRVALRLSTAIPGHLPGPAPLQLAGTASHMAMYGFMTFMPVSGVMMGYYGGKGLPFFIDSLKIPGVADPTAENKATAKWSYQW